MEKSKIDIIESVRLELESLTKKLKEHPEFDIYSNLKNNRYTPYFDLLVKFIKINKNEDVSKIKDLITILLKKSETYFSSLDNILILKEIYGIDKTESYINKIFADHGISDNEALDLSIIIENIESVIPSNFKKGKIDILITKRNVKSHFDIKKSQMVININQSKNNIISEIFHEFGHVLELQNPYLFQESILLIAKRTKDGTLLRSNINKGRFVHPYIGTVYDWNSTEVLSLGLQLMYLNPVMFLFRDPEHFEFIDSILRKA